MSMAVQAYSLMAYSTWEGVRGEAGQLGTFFFSGDLEERDL